MLAGNCEQPRTAQDGLAVGRLGSLATRLLHRRLHLQVGMGFLVMYSFLRSPGRSPGSAGIIAPGSLRFRCALLGHAYDGMWARLSPQQPAVGWAVRFLDCRRWAVHPVPASGGSVAVTSDGLTDSVWPPGAVRSLHRTGRATDSALTVKLYECWLENFTCQARSATSRLEYRRVALNL